MAKLPTAGMVGGWCLTSPGRIDTWDAQCSPGYCLTGFVIGVEGTGFGGGFTQISGAITGEINESSPYLVAKRSAGTYTVKATAPAGTAITSIRCDDSDSLGDVGSSSVSIVVSSGELVTCMFSADKPDTDRDGNPDATDPCPRDPGDKCDDDTDADGILDAIDPCPMDPANSCKVPPAGPSPQPSGSPTERCHSFNAAAVASLSSGMLQYSLDDVRYCTDGERTRVTSAGTERVRPIYSGQLAAALDFAGISVNPKLGGPATSQNYANGAASVTSQASVTICGQIPLSAKFLKVLSWALKFLPAPVETKFRELIASKGPGAVKKLFTSHLISERVKVKILDATMRRFIETRSPRDQAALKILYEEVLGVPGGEIDGRITNLFLKGVCVDKAWAPEISVSFTGAGTPSVYIGGIDGLFSVGPYVASRAMDRGDRRRR